MVDPSFCKRLAVRYIRYDAEDLAQELQILAWKLRGNPSPYVKRALYNLAVDCYRRRKKEKTLFLPLDKPFELIHGQATDSLLSFKYACSRLISLVSNGRHKKVLRLILKGYTSREVAKILKVSKSNVGRTVIKIKGNLLQN